MAHECYNERKSASSSRDIRPISTACVSGEREDPEHRNEELEEGSISETNQPSEISEKSCG